MKAPQTTPEPVLFSKLLEAAIANAEAVDWKSMNMITKYKIGNIATISVPVYPKRKRADEPQP